MSTIVIFDDERECVADLQKRVQSLLTPGEGHSVLPAYGLDDITAILSSGTQVDVLIADVVTPDGQPSGIEVVRGLFPPESSTQVIYMSGYLEQALEVYATEHLYFLLKPIDDARLMDALDKALARARRTRPALLRIKTGRKERLINASAITHLSSDLHKVTVHCRNGDFETHARLDVLQSQLPSSFVRCHRSHLVNLACVRTLEERQLVLHDGTCLPVSRRRAHDVQKAMLAFLSARP